MKTLRPWRHGDPIPPGAVRLRGCNLLHDILFCVDYHIRDGHAEVYQCDNFPPCPVVGWRIPDGAMVEVDE